MDAPNIGEFVSTGRCMPLGRDGFNGRGTAHQLATRNNPYRNKSTLLIPQLQQSYKERGGGAERRRDTYNKKFSSLFVDDV